jgi:hypothetical protein
LLTGGGAEPIVAGREGACRDAPAPYVTAASLQAEAEAWKFLAYVRGLLPDSEASMPQALTAHLQVNPSTR